MLFTLVLVVLVVGLVLGGTVAFVAARSRRGRLLEPPARPGVVTRPRPTSTGSAGGPPAALDERPSADWPQAQEPQAQEPQAQEPQAQEPARFSERLVRARAAFGARLGAIVSRGRIDDSVWEELEEALIVADVGVSTSMAVLQGLKTKAKSGEISSPSELVEQLRSDLVEILSSGDRSLCLQSGETNVWLFVGVNGVGKTTTIGKVAMRYVSGGHKVVLAAGDTFRAAAAEQLDQWAQRSGADVVRGGEGSDPGAVIFDAVQRASARGAELVLADTAGRLHTKINLMEELKKVHRVAQRPPGSVSEVLLVIDATTGQNGLVQAKQFAEAVGITGVVLTKLDGTAKGGIAVAIQAELEIPIKLVGLGESATDLVDFDPREFVDALIGEAAGGKVGN